MAANKSSKEINCGSCRFGMMLSWSATTVRCKRNPPTFAGTHPHEPNDWHFPILYASDYCGHWAEKEK